VVRPSGGDRRTVRSFFRLNPHVAAMALPIVQELRDDALGLPAAFLHWYRAERRAPGRRGAFENGDADVEILDEDVHVVPLHAHVDGVLDALAQRALHLRCEPKVQHLRLANAELIGLVAQDDAGRELMYFVSLDYPVIAPVVLYREDGTTRHLSVLWNGLEAVEASLAALAQALADAWHAAAPPPLPAPPFPTVSPPDAWRSA
jgi:hypothetical protein